MNGERNVYKLVFTKQCNGCGKVPTRSPTRYPTAYPTAFPTAYPTRYPTAFPTAFPTAYPTRFPTAYPTRYPTAYPTPTCATTCQLKQHQWKNGGKKEKKVIVTHDRKLQFHYHNHDQHRCYKTAAGKCECTSANGGAGIQFHQ